MLDSIRAKGMIDLSVTPEGHKVASFKGTKEIYSK